MPPSSTHQSTDSGNDTRPPPKDLSHHLSRSTKTRAASSIKAFYKYFAIPGIGQLAGGLPNNYYFPFDTLEAKIAEPQRWQPTPNKPIDPPSEEEALAALDLNDKSKTQSSPLHQPQNTLEVPHTSSQKNPLKKIDLSTALQYGTAQGYPPLYYFIRQFTQENLHPNCPYKGGPEVILTCGNTDGFSKVLQAFTNEWSEEKDWVRDREGLLVEQFEYMNAVQSASPRGLNIAPVALDDEGMRADGPGGLKDVLENWDFKKGKRPHLMYTVTMGQNPTSGVQSLERRREIYALCQKYDVLIVEDDPYWYLQFPTATAVNTISTSDATNTSFNPTIPRRWRWRLLRRARSFQQPAADRSLRPSGGVLRSGRLAQIRQRNRRRHLRKVGTSVAVFLGIPLAAAIVTRLALRSLIGEYRYQHYFIRYIAPFSLIGLLYTIIVLFGSQGLHVVEQITSVLRVCAPLVVYFLVVFTTTAWVMWRFGFGYKISCTQSFTAASNNFELAIAVVVAVYGAGSQQALAATVGP